jgi:hypothetical protein
VAAAPRGERPRPPAALFEDLGIGRFAPALDLLAWVRNTFLLPGHPLHNPDHAHLADAELGFLWTSVENTRQGKTVIGQCESPGGGRAGKWQRARNEQQLREWFGTVPDFLITLDAMFCGHADDARFCALVEHELYHAAHATDEFGSPRFHRDTGLPMFTIRGHDVEEFVGVVRRYGVVNGAVAELVIAAAARPSIGPAALASGCGTCLRLVA